MLFKKYVDCPNCGHFVAVELPNTGPRVQCDFCGARFVNAETEADFLAELFS